MQAKIRPDAFFAKSREADSCNCVNLDRPGIQLDEITFLKEDRLQAGSDALMALNPVKGHAALRRGRVLTASAEYFLTFCTDARGAGLTTPELGRFVLGEMLAMATDKTWTLRCAVIMPDHVHLLATLGDRLPLARTIQRLKAKTSACLQAGGLNWERGFFDHRLRTTDDMRDVLLYIYLNPYRAGRCARAESWPWFYCHPEDWAWFRDFLDEDRPPPDWLDL